MAFNSYIAAHSSSAGADLLLNPYEVLVLMTFTIIMTADFFSKLLHTYTTASEIMITGGGDEADAEQPLERERK